jgi:hypothetical protein
VDVPGDYSCYLQVTDENGQYACEPGHVGVEVSPALDGETEQPHLDILIELSWRTPGALGASNGADLDLHLVHEYGSDIDSNADGEGDGYFSEPWDCYSLNPNPEWGSVDPEVDDDPEVEESTLSEVLLLAEAEEGLRYKLGVYVPDDKGLGVSFAKVNIYMGGVLVYQSEEVELLRRDMWEVAWLVPSENDLEPFEDEGEVKVLPDFNAPIVDLD